MIIYEVYDELIEGGALLASSNKYYTSKEEALKALDYIKHLPPLPYDDDYSTGIREIIVEDKFTPFYTKEQVARWQKESDDYQKYLQAKEDEYSHYDNEVFGEE